MIHIKRFIDRTASLDVNNNRDFVMPASDARLLRNELALLLADRLSEQYNKRDVIEVQIGGGSFK